MKLVYMILVFIGPVTAVSTSESGVLSFPIQEENYFQTPQFNDLSKRNARAAQAGLYNNMAYYSMQLGIGNPLRFYKLAIDTGSSQLWLSANSQISNTPYDYANDRSMNLTGDSGTIKYAKGGVQYLWATTQINVAGLAVPSVPFGIAYGAQEFGNLLNGISGILGLGYSEQGRPNVGETLRNLGLISRNVYSLSLAKSSGSDGYLLFGGIDHSKYENDLKILPRRNLPGKKRKYLAVTLDTIQVGANNIHVGTAAPLDTGTTLTYLPNSIYRSILSHFNADDSQSTVYGGPIFDINVNGDKEIYFGFSGTMICVKARDIINPSPNPTYKLYPTHQDSNIAVLGIDTNDKVSNITILGASFLKSVYVVYDIDGEQIGIGQASRISGKSIIEPIVSGIPKKH